MIDRIEKELARVRGEIAALQAEEAELVIALQVIERLGGDGPAFEDGQQDDEPELELDYCTFTSAPPSGSSDGVTVTAWVTAGPVETARGSDTLTNVGAIDIYAHEDGSRECRPVEAEAEVAQPLDEPEPEAEQEGSREDAKGAKVTKAPVGARKVRSYCRQPEDCVAGAKGPCRLCHGKAKAAPTVKPQLLETRRFSGEEIAKFAPKAEPEVQAAPGAAAKANRSRADDVPAAEVAREIRAFLDRSGMTKSAFGRSAVADAKFVANLAKREAVRGKTVARIRSFIDSWKPNEAPPATAEEAKEPARRPRAPAPERRHRDPIAAQSQAVKRGLTRAAERLLDGGGGDTTGGAVSPAVRAIANDIQRTREAQERQVNPVEQARVALQRKGLVVYSASVAGGRKDRFIVSGQQKELTPAELIDLAERKTGQVFRRSAAAPPHTTPGPAAEAGRLA